MIIDHFLAASFSTTSPSLYRTIGTASRLSIFNLSYSDFRLAKSACLANFNASEPVAFFTSDSVAWLDKSNSTFVLFLLWISGSGQ